MAKDKFYLTRDETMNPLASDVVILSEYTVLEPKKPVVSVAKTKQLIEEGDHFESANPNWRGRFPDRVVHTPYNRTHNPFLLGVIKKNGQEQLVKVARDDVTKWNVFLSWFGLGKLGDTSVELKDVNRYLSKFDFKKSDTKTYKTVCKIAGLAMLHNGSPEHWKKISDFVHTSHGDFYVNPGCTFRHIRYQAILQDKPWVNLEHDGKTPTPDQPMTSKEDIEAFEKEIKSTPTWL